MSYREEQIDFVLKGFDRIGKKIETDGNHKHVLKNRTDNFITQPERCYRYHKWAGSLKSSQAFAYNIFSGMKGREFEFHMKVFNNDSQIDVKIEDVEPDLIKLFEVKMFEFTKTDKIEFKKKYFYKNEYIRADVAESFMGFLHDVIDHFDKEKQAIYGGGIKQLCSHLLGILNTMNEPKNCSKKFILYSLCFDNPFSYRFEQDIKNYKETLAKFKIVVDKYLGEIEVNSRIDYYGFLPASEFIDEKLLGKENYDYVMARYFFKP